MLESSHIVTPLLALLSEVKALLQLLEQKSWLGLRSTYEFHGLSERQRSRKLDC